MSDIMMIKFISPPPLLPSPMFIYFRDETCYVGRILHDYQVSPNLFKFYPTCSSFTRSVRICLANTTAQRNSNRYPNSPNLWKQILNSTIFSISFEEKGNSLPLLLYDRYLNSPNFSKCRYNKIVLSSRLGDKRILIAMFFVIWFKKLFYSILLFLLHGKVKRQTFVSNI